MLIKMPTKNADIYECKLCDFICSKYSNYDKHLSTRKHILLTKIDIDNKNANNLSCSACGKNYLSRVGLWKHEKKCITNGQNQSQTQSQSQSQSQNQPQLKTKIKPQSQSQNQSIKNEIIKKAYDIDRDIEVNIENSEKKINNAITKDMFMELMNDNKEMIKIIKDQQEQIKNMIPKMGNTFNNNTTNNNNFNLNVFLNEQCKDAININDFINSLKITLEDLYFTRKNGIVQGISNLMINGLKELDVYKRPIHCTDFKRDTVYIKEHDKWEKDDNNRIMKKTIEHVANKQRNKISDWVDLHPDWIEDEQLQYEYLTILNKITEPIEDDDKLEKKIIRSITKEVQLTDFKKF
jgi:hypothetical protein